MVGILSHTFGSLVIFEVADRLVIAHRGWGAVSARAQSYDSYRRKKVRYQQRYEARNPERRALAWRRSP